MVTTQKTEPPSESERLAGQRVRVLIVDDSSVIRHLISRALDEERNIEVVGTAVNGEQALGMIKRLRPDLVTLDVEMPVMDGMKTLDEIRQVNRSIRVLMCSTLTEHGGRTAIEALNRGASDYVTKPTSTSNSGEAMDALRRDLVPKVLQFFPNAGPSARFSRAQLKPGKRKGPAKRALPLPRHIIAIGVSTGGPNALGVVLSALPAKLDLPVVVTQHMPPVFTRLLADRLNQSCKLPVHEARQGDTLRAGHVYIAPGDFHLTLKRVDNLVSVELTQSPPENSCRPAVDVMFRSVAETYGGQSLAVVLTGMGSDGMLGAQILKEKGAMVLAQDEASSVVWGMPGAVVNEGLADYVLPLDQMAMTIARKV